MTDWEDIDQCEPLVPLEHPMVEECTQTCFACPEAYEGLLKDGRAFYFRYRYGTARLGVGRVLDDAVWASSPLRRHHPQPPETRYALKDVGDDLQGMFDNTEQRDEIFNALMKEVLG